MPGCKTKRRKARIAATGRFVNVCTHMDTGRISRGGRLCKRGRKLTDRGAGQDSEHTRHKSCTTVKGKIRQVESQDQDEGELWRKDRKKTGSTSGSRKIQYTMILVCEHVIMFALAHNPASVFLSTH